MNARWLANLKELFGIDVRSLAVLRIGLACIILWDLLFYRWPMLELFYTDGGILPRDLVQTFSGEGYWSLYFLDGSDRWSTTLMIVNGSLPLDCYSVSKRGR